MKTKTILLSLLLLAGCDAGSVTVNPMESGMIATPDSEKVITVQIGKTSNGRIERFHDDEMNATCWIVDGYRQFQCIPDTMLVRHKGATK